MSYRNYKKNFEEELVLAETRITLDDKHYDNVKRDYNFEDINCLDTDKINVFLDKWIDDNEWHFFHKSTKESYFKKILSNSWDFVVDWSLNIVGNQHFAITINMPQDMEWLNNYDSYKMCDYIDLETRIKNHIFAGFKTVSFMYLVAEQNKNGKLHFHILLSIRNFVDYSYTLRSNLIIWMREFDYTYTSDYDIKVEFLPYFKDVKNWALYLYKDMYRWRFPSKLYILSAWKDIFENHLAEITFVYLQINCDFIYLKSDNDLINTFYGVKIVNNKIDHTILLDLLQYYLIFSNYYIYNNSIYVKVASSKISYRLVGTLNKILYDEFQKNVVTYFNLDFDNYFRGFDFNYLLKNFFVKSKTIIESIRDISTQRIELDFSLIEFTDGVYSIRYDRFFPNKDKYFFSNKIATTKYYKKSYDTTKRKIPLNWINSIKHAIDISHNELLDESYLRLCMHIINTVHKDIFDKKSTLFVYGKSNTGKTTLVGNVILNYFGSDNVGSIVSAKNFKWQEFYKKLVAIIDEGRYSPFMSSDLLKITGQEEIIIEKKYSKEHVSIKPIPMIILSNTLFEDKDEYINESLNNRLYIIKFVNSVREYNLKDSKKFKKALKDEEASIIVYCNKLMFKICKDSVSKVGNKISNIEILKEIEKKFNR